jgi:general secretion pathway protein N
MTLPPFAKPAMLAAALALAAAAELCTPLPLPPMPPPIRISPATAAQEADLSAAAGSWSDTILQRPLFRPDRRPLAHDAAVITPLPRLSAIVITASGGAAIFSGDDGKAVTVNAGGVIDGYRVETIGPGEVNITGPAGNRTLHPQFAPGTQQDAAPPPFTPPQHSLDNY